MKLVIVRGSTSNILRVLLQDSSSTTGAGLTGLTNSSTGLNISWIRETEASATTYTSAGSTIDTITTLGTFAAPSASHCRFKEVDSTNLKGIYEIQLADATFNATGSNRHMILMVSGATNLAPCTIEIQLTGMDLNDGVHGGMTALPNAAAAAAGGLWILGANAAATTTLTGVAASSSTPATAALALTGGAADTTSGGTASPALTMLGGAGAASTNGAASGATIAAGGTNTVASTADGLTITGTSNGNGLTLVHAGTGKDFNATTTPLTLAKTTNITGFNDITAAAAATGVWQDTTSGDFTVASSIGKSLYTSGNAPGAASGLLIAGSNAQTTFASGSHFIGTVDTVTTVTNQLTAAAIATGVWQDATAGDFTVASSIGNSLYTGNHAPGAASGLALVGSNMGTVTSVTGAVGSVTAAVTLSAGDSPVMQSGTATAGGASTITIQTALGHDSLPVGCLVKITGGTGADQCRVITGYVDSTQVVTVDRAWTTNPNNTSVYSILYNDAPALSSGLKVSEVVLCDTITTYTGDTPQTGDSFARLGAPAGASIAADLAEIEAETDGIAAIPTTPLLAANVPANFSALLISAGGHISNVDTLTTYTGNTVQTGDSYARLGVPAGASVSADIAEIEGETDTLLAGVNATQIGGNSTAATNLANAYGAIETGTAQGGGASTITLRPGASGTDNFYANQAVFILSGTGGGQTNKIQSYVGATKVATVETAWVTQPDNTSVYVVLGRIG